MPTQFRPPPPLMSLLLPLTHGSAIDAFLADPATTSPNEPPQHMITKAELQIQTEERIVVRTVLITDRNYYEFRLDDPITFQPIPPSRTSLTKTKPLIDIHSVETVQGQPRQFVMHFFSGSVADKTKRQLSRMKRLLQSASITPSFIIKTKIFTCATPFHTIQWIFLLQRLIRNLWQQTFENQFIPSPEIYQRHCFVIKKSADRILLISTRWMYNIAVTFKPTLVKDLKWAIPLATLTLITINTDDTCPNAQIMFDEMEAAKHQDQQHTGHKNKTGFNNKKHKRTISTSSSFDTVESITTGYSHAWIFRTVQERNRTVTLLVRLHLELTGKQLQVEVEPDKRTKTGTGPAFLEELVLRNQTGHTLQPSRIKNENISYETTREMTVAEGDEDGISSQPIKSGKDKEKCIIE